MIGDYTYYEFSSILAMQAFAGLILFSVFVMMALGLAIIFGQMGVIKDRKSTRLNSSHP